MSSSGPNSPGTLASDSSNGGAQAWTNPTNAGANDASYATSTLSNGATDSHYLKATNFGFSIPAGATINGIVVEIEQLKTGNAARNVSDEVVKLVKGGTVSGNNKANGINWPTSEAYATYGASSDLWGVALTSSDVNSSGFGVVASAVYGGGTFSATANIDHIRITVYYTAAAAAAHAPYFYRHLAGGPS